MANQAAIAFQTRFHVRNLYQRLSIENERDEIDVSLHNISYANYINSLK